MMKTKNKTKIFSSNVIIVGEAFSKTINRECCLCHNNYIMSTNDYIQNNCGLILYRPKEGADSWICKECVDKIQEIKELIK